MLRDVGVLDLFNGKTRGRLSGSLSLPIVSPWSARPQFQKFVIDDLLGGDAKNMPLDRAAAIAIPAVSKARNLLIATIADLPLRALRANADGTDTDVTDQYPWLYRTNGTVSPQERMAWTVDDCIFYGCSLWLTDLGAETDDRRTILNAEWCPTSRWEIRRADDGTLGIYVDGELKQPQDYILINSPFEGLLTVGQRTLRGARDVEESWVGRARNPIPLIVLRITDDVALGDSEIEDFVDSFATARTDPNGAIGFLPAGVEMEVFGTDAPDLAVEGRNAVRTDVGSHLNVRASVLDGTQGVASLTYATTQGERNAFYDDDVPFWTGPIEWRLSLDDLVPRGVRIRFDKTDQYNPPAPTGPRVED